jgi:hypothetical protein
MYVTTVEASGKTRSKLDEIQSGTKSGAFSKLTPSWSLMYFFGGFSLISPGFRPNSRVLVSCFPDFTKNSTKHPENRCPYVLIPCQKIFNWYFLRFSKGQFPMGENGRACHLCMWKPPMFTLRIGMKTMKVFIEKVRTAHHWFLPMFIIWPEKIFFPSKFSYVLFRNPTHKTKTGTANRCGTTNFKPRGPIIMMGQPPQ